MRDWDNSYLARLNAEEAATFWLVKMEIADSTYLHSSTLDIDIAVDGQIYTSTEFRVNPISYNLSMAVDKVRLDYANVDLSMSSILLNNSVKKRPCIIYLGAMDGMTPVVEAVFYGIVQKWDADEKQAEIQIVNEFIFWNKKTLRLPSDLCQWPFKSTECGYTGLAVLCNGTYSRCTDLANTDNFGGFRFLPALEEKEIWWGQKSA